MIVGSHSGLIGGQSNSTLFSVTYFLGYLITWEPPTLDFIRKVDNDCFLPFPDLFVREGGEQE